MNNSSFFECRFPLFISLASLFFTLPYCSSSSEKRNVDVDKTEVKTSEINHTKMKKSSKKQHLKFRQECALTSSKFKNNLPSGMVDVWCADDKSADLGAMGPDVVHAMVAAAFYDKRMDRRLAAMNLLETYTCPTAKDCKELLYLLEWGIKSGHPAKYSKDLANRATALREQTKLKL